MTPNDKHDKRKLLPSYFPELDLETKWKSRYKELQGLGYNQTNAIYEISKESNGVSRTAIRKVLFTRDKEKAKKRASVYEDIRKTNPDLRKRDNTRHAKYMSVRRHIGSIIMDIYKSNTSQGEAFTLLAIGDKIKDSKGVFLKPKSLETLLVQYEQKHGRPLLQEHGHYQPPKYIPFINKV